MVPVQDALSVPEILEGILLNLPLRQIIRLRSLCHESRRIIDGTNSIQRALFLSPSSDEKLLHNQPRQVGFDQMAFPQRLSQYLKMAVWKHQGKHDSPPRMPLLNPFFPITPNVDEKLYDKQWYASKCQGMFLNVGETFALQSGSGQQGILRIDFPNDFYYQHAFKGIFAGMYFSHPPISHLRYTALGDISKNENSATIRSLMLDHLHHGGGWDLHTPQHVGFSGGHKIAILARTVDEITGYEMLAILDSGVENLSKDLFVKDKQTGQARFRAY